MSNTKIWFVSILLIVTVAACIFFHNILLLLLSSAVIAFLLTPFVNYIQRKFHLKHRLFPSLVALLLGLCVIAGILALVLPPLYKQIENVVSSIDFYVAEISRFFDNLAIWLESLGVSDRILAIFDEAAGGIGTTLTSVVTTVGSYILQQTTKLVNVLIVFIMTIYFMKDGSKLLHKILNSCNDYLRIRLKRIGNELNDLIWGYLKIKILTSLVVFVVTFIVYTAFSVPNALLLAILAFLLEFIPYFGPIISAFLASLATLITKDFSTAIWILVADILIQQIDGNVVEPIVQGKKADVHPLAIVVSLLFCEKIWGVLGMFIACPMAGFARVLFYELKDLYASIDSPYGFGYATEEPLIKTTDTEEKQPKHIRLIKKFILKKSNRGEKK